MSFLREELVNFSAKGWLEIGTANRDTAPKNLTWYEEITTNNLITIPSQIWVEFSSISEAKDLTTAQANASANPTIIDDLTGVNAIHCTPSNTNTTFFATTTYGDLTTRIGNWIMPQLVPRTDAGFKGFPSIGYSVRVYQGDPNSGGVEITTSDDQVDAVPGWWMNFGAGAVSTAASFSKITDPTDIWITGFRYIGKDLDSIGSGSGSPDTIPGLTCTATESVRDVVYVSGSNTVLQAKADDISTGRAFGFIVSKQTATTCTVQTKGTLSGFSGLVSGKTYFLDPSTGGEITTTPPTSSGEVLIKLGRSVNSTTINVDIDTSLVIRA